MKKAVSAVLTISKNMLCIGFGIQIILGIIWMCCNFPRLMIFQGQGSRLFQQLVPVLAMVYPPVYLLQIAAAGIAGYYLLLQFFREKKKAVFGALVLLTFPMGMQTHLAIAPFSLVSSLTLLLLGILVHIREEEKASVKEFAAACLCWVGMSFLLPPYFVVGLAAILSFLVMTLLRKTKNQKKGAYLVITAAFCGFILGVNAITWQDNMLPDAEQVSYSLCSRMSWPTLLPDHERWPAELVGVAEENLLESSLFADRMEEEFRPLVTGTFGKQKAAGFYRAIAADSWNRHAKLIIRQIVGDFAAYVMTPVILPVQLAGKAYPSYSGRNYAFFLQQTPALSKRIMTFFVRWFVLMFAVSALMTLLQFKTFWQEKRDRIVPVVILSGMTALTTGVIYTFRGAGIMDYKCSIFVNLLWLAWAVTLITADSPKENRKEL